MTVHSAKEFQEYVFHQLHFTPVPKNHYTLYQDSQKPDNGYCCIYSRNNYYELGIADYTVPEDFSVTFSSQDRKLRFGTLFYGKTHFKLQHQEVSSFTPSSFLVLEENLKGRQVFKAGDHYHGIEFTVFDRYIEEVICRQFENALNFSAFTANRTYKFLPQTVITVLNRILSLHTQNRLPPMMLEGLLLTCLALFAQEFEQEQNCFTNQISHSKIKIGRNRFLSIHYEDKKAVFRAHDILTEQFKNPPTIQDLSEQVLLSSQKLKYAFAKQYHMTIYEYILSLRMAYSANLLRTTNLSVEEIAAKTGYHYPGNFIQMFKKTYGKTPLKYRREAEGDEKEV